jgi:hypothetical protein
MSKGDPAEQSIASCPKAHPRLPYVKHILVVGARSFLEYARLLIACILYNCLHQGQRISPCIPAPNRQRSKRSRPTLAA